MAYHAPMAERGLFVGIALDSGGAMGGAHVGVLEVLAENGIHPDIVVGSSAGAAVGALYASGRLAELKRLITDMSFVRSLGYYVDPVFPYAGLLAGNKVRALFKDLVGDVNIEDLDIRFVAVATDLLTGETVAIDKGPLADAIMASIAIPGIFRPVVHMGRLLTDGGVSDPLPLDVLKSYGPVITIACNLHPRMTTRYSQAARRDMVEAERKALDEDEELGPGIVNRIVGLVNARAFQEGLAPLAKALKDKIGSSLKGTPMDSDVIRGVREYITQQLQRLGDVKLQMLAPGNHAHRMNIIEILLNATNIQQFQKNRLMLKYDPPDILIEPDVVDIAALEFSKSAIAMEEGRKKALEALPMIRRIVEERSRTT